VTLTDMNNRVNLNLGSGILYLKRQIFIQHLTEF